MALAAPHPCNHPGCPALVPMGTPNCPVHTRARHREDRARRGSWRERGYDSRWDRKGGIRDQHLNREPLCRMCAAKNPPRITPGAVVDHIKAWQSGATEAERQRLFSSDDNLQTLCASCHGVKTATEDGSFGRARR